MFGATFVHLQSLFKRNPIWHFFPEEIISVKKPQKTVITCVNKVKYRREDLGRHLMNVDDIFECFHHPSSQHSLQRKTHIQSRRFVLTVKQIVYPSQKITRKSSCVNARGIPPARGRKMLTPPPVGPDPPLGSWT